MARTVLLGPERVRRTVTRLAYEVVERNRGADNLIVFGLRHRGVALAYQLAETLSDVAERSIPVHALDVSSFRDDRAGDSETALPADAPDATDRDVLIVDDVLFTGRTARAALDAVLQHGRPRTIQLAVLIDRGHREVPVHPDYVGRVIPTKAAERVIVDPDMPSVYLED